MADALTFSIDTAGLDRKIRALDALNSVGFWETIGASIKTQVNLGFRMARDPWGNPWPAVKFRTRNGKPVPGPYQPLRDTGRMQRSIYALADNTGVTVGLNVKAPSGASIASVHQFGATITPKRGQYLVFDGPNGLIRTKSVTIPARPFLPIRTPGGPVDLPPIWSKVVVDRIRPFLVQKLEAA